MRIGSARVSKTDGSQSLDLQRDALRAAGVDKDGRASGVATHAFPHLETRRIVILSVDEHPASIREYTIERGGLTPVGDWPRTRWRTRTRRRCAVPPRDGTRPRALGDGPPADDAGTG